MFSPRVDTKRISRSIVFSFLYHFPLLSFFLFKLFRDRRKNEIVLASHIFPFYHVLIGSSILTKLAKRNRSTMHKFRMEFRDRPRVSICSGTITPTDNRGYFHKITTQIRVSWPPLPSSTAISSPLAPIDSCVYIRIITTPRITFLPPPSFFSRAISKFTSGR